MNIEKIAELKQVNEPYLRPISTSGIGFYNQDINTAKIKFQVTRNNSPQLLSDKNVISYALFKSENGSTSGFVDVEYIDELNGILQVTIPNDFLKAATDTSVVGQLMITVNGKDDTVVLGEFSFRVKDSLINSIPSEVKITYIKMFDELKAKIEKIVDEIKSGYKDSQTLIEQLNEAFQESKQDLNLIIENAKTQVNSSSEEAIENINNKTSEASSLITNAKDNAVTVVNDKLDEFNTNIANNDFLQPTDLDVKLNSLNWQKYKLTEPDGKRIKANNADITSLATGLYQVTNAIGIPLGVGDSNSSWNVDVSQNDSSTKQIIAVISNLGRVFIKNIHNGSDLGWKEITPQYDFSKFQQYQLTNHDGTQRYVNLNNSRSDMQNLVGGPYYATNVPISTSMAKSTSGYLTYLKRNDGVAKYIEFKPYNSTQKFVMRFYNTWGEWERVGVSDDTGWQPLTLINGVTSFNQSTIPSYRIMTINECTIISLKGEIKNINTTGLVIANLPANFVSKITRDLPFAQNTTSKEGIGSFANWKLYRDGAIKLENVNYDSSKMDVEDWYSISHTITV